jgi:hypothetical protein
MEIPANLPRLGGVGGLKKATWVMSFPQQSKRKVSHNERTQQSFT